MQDSPKRALKRIQMVDRLDGDPVACTWDAKPAWFFLLRGGVALAAESRFPASTRSVPYLRVRMSGDGTTRHVVFDEGEADLVFADDAIAIELELVVLQRQQRAEEAHRLKVEAERAAAEAAGTVTSSSPNTITEALGLSSPSSTKSVTSSEDGLVRRLERLAALHASGQLTDEEYAAAKARLLSD
jgi:hypothetical protein